MLLPLVMRFPVSPHPLLASADDLRPGASIPSISAKRHYMAKAVTTARHLAFDRNLSCPCPEAMATVVLPFIATARARSPLAV